MCLNNILRFALAISLLLLLANVNCKKTPTSPDTDRITNPTIWTDVTSLSFTGTESGLNPSSQTLRIRNSGSKTLNYTLSDDADWLSCTPPSGSSTGNTNEHIVSVDTWGLNEGNYSGVITITASGTTNSPQKVDVNLDIVSPLSDNEISVSCEPSSGGAGNITIISISIKGNIQEINSFGIELSFDNTMFEYQSITRGDLIEDWAGLAGYLVSSGTVRIGGFAGGADSIPRGYVGTLVKVILSVTCSECDDGKQGQICIQNYADDIWGMISESTCTTFTFNK